MFCLPFFDRVSNSLEYTWKKSLISIFCWKQQKIYNNNNNNGIKQETEREKTNVSRKQNKKWLIFLFFSKYC